MTSQGEIVSQTPSNQGVKTNFEILEGKKRGHRENNYPNDKRGRKRREKWEKERRVHVWWGP